MKENHRAACAHVKRQQLNRLTGRAAVTHYDKVLYKTAYSGTFNPARHTRRVNGVRTPSGARRNPSGVRLPLEAHTRTGILNQKALEQMFRYEAWTEEVEAQAQRPLVTERFTHCLLLLH